MKNPNHFINVILQDINFDNFFDFCDAKPIQVSTLKLHKQVTYNFLKENFHFKYEINNRGVELFKRMFDTYFKTKVLKREMKGKNNVKILNPKTKNQINKWEINEDFYVAIQDYKKYSVAYTKTQQTTEKELVFEDDSDSNDSDYNQEEEDSYYNPSDDELDPRHWEKKANEASNK